jgi:stalled ribosome rescue protein Dom34
MKQMAVWMDHHQARIFDVDGKTFDERTVESVTKHVHRHSMDSEMKTHNHPDDEHRFFREITHQLAGADQILVLGPSVTKLRFIKYAHAHDQALASTIVGVETADHPTDRQIVAHVRHYFHGDLPRLGVGT